MKLFCSAFVISSSFVIFPNLNVRKKLPNFISDHLQGSSSQNFPDLHCLNITKGDFHVFWAIGLSIILHQKFPNVLSS